MNASGDDGRDEELKAEEEGEDQVTIH